MRVDLYHDIHARPHQLTAPSPERGAHHLPPRSPPRTNSRTTLPPYDPRARAVRRFLEHAPAVSVGIRIPPSAAAILRSPSRFGADGPLAARLNGWFMLVAWSTGARVAVPAAAEANHHYNHHAPTLHIQLRPTYRPDPWPAALPAAFHARCRYRAGSESIPDLPSQLDASVRDFPSPSSPAHSGSGHSSGRASTTSAGSTTRRQMCSARMADERRGMGMDTAR
ncbi:hypothetical protein B0H19DRAFT_479198 [Mycena capillaripes]|nr:hypothetical protein B0H19DRAFT_479198 [Mycena capillaripes]